MLSRFKPLSRMFSSPFLPTLRIWSGCGPVPHDPPRVSEVLGALGSPLDPKQVNKLKPTKNLSRTIEKLRDKILDLSLISVERQLRKLKLTYYMQGNKAGSKLPKATSLLPTTVALFHNWKQTTPLFLRNNDLLLAAPLQALSTKTSNIHLDNWLKQGITQVRSLLSAEGIKPFPDLIREFHIPSRELFSYLRLKNIIQESGISLREPDPTPPFIHKCMGKLPKTKALSLCYNTLLLHDKLSKPSYMSKWESDLGKLFSNELWHRAQRLTKQASHSLNQWETYCKLTMRWYLVPTKLARIYPGSDSSESSVIQSPEDSTDAAGGEIFNQCVADQDEAFTEKDVIRLIHQILQGISYLHRNNVVHLDLKPQNILLTCSNPLGDIRIVDFGLSRQVDTIKEVREILGTPEYVAPEVLNYEPISTATDMWSVGVLTYVMLTGESPFLGDTKQETFLNISQVNIEYSQGVFEGISDQAVDFIKSLLIKNPRKRARADQCLKHPWLSPQDESDPLKDKSFEQNESELKTPDPTKEIVLLASYTVRCPCHTIETDLNVVRKPFTGLPEIQQEVVC
ncbi:serine threonine- kinase 17A-like [Pelobates cultripes]|uniref:Serine threonine- kinase 17A-like n=1 Tax=Pelobates cultripes TaxID=61616 RepID=A0AAD1WC54_PELCU|nr:serine threonine- kinase 17A-like [Pelobates cultripes]